MTDFIPLCVPSVGSEELALLEQCIADNFVSSVGPFVTEFEQEFAAAVGAAHAVATSSGTTALHVAMLLHDIGPADLVAVSDFTFIASANAVAYTGADILLVDSEVTTWNMNTELLRDEVVRRAASGERIPALVEIVHILGHPADIEPILELRDRFGIAIVEDAAESLGASHRTGPLDGIAAGMASGLGCYSFNGNKIMTTGSGGMLCTNDEAQATRARHLTTQAKLPGPNYFHDEVGYNYRMSNVTAALGLAQVRKLPRFIDAKRSIAAAYGSLLDHESITLPPHSDDADPTHWLYTIRVPADLRDPLVAAMRDAAIGSRSVWSPVSAQQPYAHCDTLGSGVGDDIFDTAVSLPSSVDLTGADLERVAATVNQVMSALSGN